jgi:Phosphotransferase enzyme family
VTANEIRVAETAADLTADWFTSTLQASGVLQIGDTVNSASTRPLGNGHIGQVLRAELDYSRHCAGPASLVVKLPAVEESRRQMAVGMGLYESEVRFYRDIAPRVGVAVPELYASALEPGTGGFTLLVEDLSATTTVGETVGGASLEQSAMAISALPALQAPLWHAPDLVADPWWGNHSRSHVFFTMLPQMLPLLEQRLGARLSGEHLHFMRWAASVADRLPATVWNAPYVIAHGDFRLDNMLFAAVPGAAPMTVIDWQAARLAPPLADAAMFLGPNLAPEVRRQHEKDLLHLYHNGLLATGLDGFDFQDCWTSYRLCALYPLCGAIATATGFALNDEDADLWVRILDHCTQMAIDLDTAALIK